jgi:hypothetical protein
MRLWPCIIGFKTMPGSAGKLSIFSNDDSSARAHAAAARHNGGGVAIEVFRSLLAELIESMVAIDYWPVSTVEHPLVRKYLGDGTPGKEHLNTMIERLYEWVVIEVAQRIGREEFLSMLSDSWSRFGLSMFGLVALGTNAAWLLDVVVPQIQLIPGTCWRLWPRM